MVRHALFALSFLVASSSIMTEFFDDSMSVTCAAGYDRPVGDPHQSRSVVLAKHGIVATSHPLAAQTGLDVLKSGGNAADAAIAASAMMGLVEPMSCGIGGDLFAIYWDNKTQKLYGLNASGRSPAKLTREEFLRLGHQQIPTYGPLSWSVPGCVSGWDELHRRFGSKSFEELLAPTIVTADEGFPISEIIAGSWRSAERRLKEWPDSAKTYLVDGDRAPKFGEMFKNARLAESYRRIATNGPDAFYRGEIAKTIVAFSEANGGFLSLKDFQEHRADWVDPVSTNYRGYDLWELPPNGQGIAALQILNALEPFAIKSMGYGSPEYLHLFIEAKKLAFADRAKFYADPEFNKLPTAELISKKYAARQVERIDRHRSATDVPAGNPKLAHGDTIYLTVVDKNRNCCSFIQSNYYGFGSQIVPGDVGFVLQNRGALFSLEEGHLNVYEPQKRPFHTIIPAMLTKDGQPYFCFGVMGGDMQPQGHAQVVVNLIDFGMNVQAAGDAARVRHTGSAQPTGVAANGAGIVQVESGISSEAVEALRALGHQVVRAKGAFGGYQGILIDHEHGVLHGGTEARKDGVAVGY
jgi:gamma-glutamyltranspeptidase / glutathione hydrolase